MFILDVCSQVSKLDLKSLKFIFLGYSYVQKWYRCNCFTLRRYFVSIDVTFFETTPFSLSSIVTSQEEDDDLLVYTIFSPAPTPALFPVRPHITQVYSHCQNLLVYTPRSTTSSSNLVQSYDLLIALRKGKCWCAHPISSFVSYNHLLSSSYSFIASPDSISLLNTICEALSHLGWRCAMVEEMHALDDSGTWDLVPLPTRKKAIGCCWFLQ